MPVMRGVRAGLIGAAVIAVFFLVIDIALDRAFWTPAVLGSVLFLGKLIGPDAPIRPVLVVAYTVLHSVSFVAAALIASHLLSSRKPPITAKTSVLYVAGLFALLEVIFLGFAELTAPVLIGMVGAGRIATANLLAAIAITADLLLGVRRVAAARRARIEQARQARNARRAGHQAPG
jgi:hypothetical protein